MEIEEVGKLWIIFHFMDFMEIYAGAHTMTCQEIRFKTKRGVRCCESDQENEREARRVWSL